MYETYEISKELEDLVLKVEDEIKDELKKIDDISLKNTIKVLKAFQKCNISEMHFGSTTGYGYSDIGRDTIEKVFSDILKVEDSLVRTQFISGTHALSTTLFALLHPNETMISINGKPYDTLDEVIGLVNNESSLMSYGIKYEQIDLIGNEFGTEAITKRLSRQDVKLVEIQRSRGYSARKSLSMEKIKNIIDEIRKVNTNVIIMVDNCYGEFVESAEPSEVGADIIVGSLIKNMGGGIASNGAYVAGRRNLVDLVSQRLTAPGLGKEVGPSLGINKYILQGLFFAPSVVASSLKTAIFASKLMSNLGYEVSPEYNENRSDIVQTITFGDSKKLIKFCQGIQMGSPIDSKSVPEPWDMPGYTDKVIMAAGTFTAGSSIELSCDAPIREPYTAFLQGGLTYEYGKLGVIRAVENLL
ncbi:MAG: methionine gamma-lyase family protein [Lachnospiraceae bacterium]|jgi:cystathionine beta-lyase family protein involved in aluminum resistance|nr:methionine gamma-lyase family protein [Lachnospiraceae bacterium]